MKTTTENQTSKITVTATTDNPRFGARDIFSEIEITENTTKNDILEFVKTLTENTSDRSVRISFCGDDGVSDDLEASVSIPTLPYSDNFSAPIHIIMDSEDVSQLLDIVIDRIVEAARSMYIDCCIEYGKDSDEGKSYCRIAERFKGWKKEAE